MKAESEKLSFTELKRRGAEIFGHLRETGQPLQITVKGQGSFVILTAEPYEKRFEDWDRAQAIEGIRRGLESMRAGKGLPADEVFAALEEKYPYLRRS